MSDEILNVRGINKDQKEGLSLLAQSSLGTKSASAFVRYLIAEALKKLEKNPAKRPIKITNNNKKTVTFTIYEEEHRVLSSISNQAGSKPAFYCASLIKTHIHNAPYLLENELEVLREANYQLASIGRNLNQIARHLNANISGESLTLDQINALSNLIKKHVEKMNGVIDANVKRSR